MYTNQNSLFSQNNFKNVLNSRNLSTIEDNASIHSKSNISNLVSNSIAKKIMIIILAILFLGQFINNLNYVNESMNLYLSLNLYLNMKFKMVNVNNGDYLVDDARKYLEYNDYDNFNSKIDEYNSFINQLYIKVNNNKITENNTNQVDNSILSSYLINNILWKYNTSYYPIHKIIYNNVILYDNYSINIRNEEVLYSYSNTGLSLILYSNYNYTLIESLLSLIRTFYIFILVFYLLKLLENDAKTVILEPLQVMIEVVKSVSKNPINAKNIENIGKTISLSIKRLIKKNKENGKFMSFKNKNIINSNNYDFESQYEVQIIQLAIVKISALLAISFGEAGGEIIKSNISSNSQLNPLIKGKKTQAIFGFCDIRKFSDINEALEEKTMLFVNEIAELVHSCIEIFGGSTNKNIGEVFLMVWRNKLDNIFDFYNYSESNDKQNNNFIRQNNIIERKFSELQSNDNISNINRNSIFNNRSFIADQSVLAYLFCIHKINISYSIVKYRENSDIIKKLGNDFKVSMGFGLHTGWAIEGAIGSFYKIDASYLSPNVNIAARLMAATKQYKVSILISGILYDQLSQSVKNLCRKIDVVRVKGSNKPLELYTIDINKSPKVKNEEVRLDLKERKKLIRQERKEIIKSYKQNNYSFSYFIKNNKSIKEILKNKKSKIFYQIFKEGLNAYITGNWFKAKEKFEDCIYIDSEDGPTQTLYEYIKNRNFNKPDNWDGCRTLMSK